MSTVSKCVQRELTWKINQDLSEQIIDERRVKAFPSKYAQIKQYLWERINKLFNK